MSKRKAESEAVETVETEAVEVAPDEQAPEQPPVVDEQPPAADEPGYRVVWHIKHAGRLYGPGERITELDDDAAAPFLASGAIA